MTDYAEELRCQAELMNDPEVLLYAAHHIEQLREEVRHLRIDNARLRDEAAISTLPPAQGNTP